MIADDNKEFCVLVQEYIEEQADMELVEVAYNGMEVLKNSTQLCRMSSIGHYYASFGRTGCIREISGKAIR